MQRTLRAKKGFTFIEMALVVGLMSMLGLAGYKALANGLRIWERTRTFSVDEDVAIFLSKLTRDLHNAFAYSVIAFEGDDEHLIFPTIVWTQMDKKVADGKVDHIRQIGQVEYYFDKINARLMRRQANYSQALDDERPQERLIASPVENVQFLYYYIEDEKPKIKRRVKDSLPNAVAVKVEFAEETGKKREVTRIINLPIGT